MAINITFLMMIREFETAKARGFSIWVHDDFMNVHIMLPRFSNIHTAVMFYLIDH